MTEVKHEAKKNAVEAIKKKLDRKKKRIEAQMVTTFIFITFLNTVY